MPFRLFQQSMTCHLFRGSLLVLVTILPTLAFDFPPRAGFLKDPPLQEESLMLLNSNDLSYYANITIAGETYTVLVDTGSSDLWVTGPVKQTIDTGARANVTYAANSVQGLIKRASMVFADKGVKEQAFLEVTPVDSDDFKFRDRYGILGLGPPAASSLLKVIPDAVPLLHRVFEQNHTTGNTFTLLLGRTKDVLESFTGNITIGDVLPGFQAILHEPKLNITKVPVTKSSDQHIQFLLDPDGIIGPDGQAIPLQTDVQGTADKHRPTVVLDSGFSLPQLPDFVVGSIYSRFKGAKIVQVPGIGESWILPCEQEVNITFRFSGRNVPLHPLDMSMEMRALGLPELDTSDGERACLGTFQPFTYDRGREPNYDIVLGMAFMRNVYTLVNYGNMIRSSNSADDPYVQLLPLTNTTEAHRDFVRVRLGGNDTTSTRKVLPSNTSKGGSHDAIYYILAGVAALILLLVLGMVCFLRTRRRSTR